MIKSFWPAILLSFFYPIYKIRTNREKRILQDYDFLSQIGFILALIIASWTVFTKIWTYENGFLPAVAGLAMSAGLGFDQLIEKFTKFSNSKRSAIFQGAGLILLLIQFAILYYSPFDQLPTEQDRQAKANFVQRLSNLEGEILIYQHGYFNVLAGKDSYLHISFYGDVLGGNELEGTDRNDWRREMTLEIFEDTISHQYFEWIIVGEKHVKQFSPYYIESSEPPIQFYPVTGAPGQKEYFLRRNPDALGGKQSLSSLIRDSQFSEVVEI
jgi:hypothetical protein